MSGQSTVPPPLPSFPSPPSLLLMGGSPAQLAMRAQAVLPAFPSLTPTVSASSLSLSPSSSPPLSSTPSEGHITHVHLSSGAPMHSSSPSFSARRDMASSSLSLSGPPFPPPASLQCSLPLASSTDERYASLSVAAAESVASRAHKAAICALLEALQTTMFTRKKEALDAYHSYVSTSRPRFTRPDALLLLYGSPVTPNSTLSSFQSTAAFSRIDRGLLAASGQLSWKNHQLRASATKALGVLAMLLDTRHNSDAPVFHQLILECDYSVIRLIKLPKHLSAPSPSSSAHGNLHAALRVIDIVRELRPDLIDALLEEKDAAAAQSAHSRLSAHTGSNSHGGGAVGPRSAPPTLHINIQSNSTVGTPRSSPLHDPAPPSPRSPNSPPPLPRTFNDAHNTPTQPNTAHRPPPPLPSSIAPSIFQQSPPPPPALHFAPPPSVNTCQSPHSAMTLSPWMSAIDGGNANTLAYTAPTTSTDGGSGVTITQPLSACSSPQASKKKHFSSLPAGLQRLNAPSSHYHTATTVGRSHTSGSGGSLPSDDWKQRLRSHLSGFFAHRVSREELERTGVLKRSLVFGVPLHTLSASDDADHDANIPRVLRRCLDVLNGDDILALPGLFRISGDSREINEMKVRLDVGEPVDLHSATPHSVAGLMKMWLRELPEPLLTFDLYAPIIAAVRASQQQQHQQQQQPADMLDSLNALLEQLPAAHRHTLAALLPFLHRVSACSSVNLMTASNLAICFSPNILRPKIETLESVARDTPIAIAAITALIQQVNQPHYSTSQQPVSPTSPITPTATATASKGVVPSLPPPLPSSPRSMSLPAVVVVGGNSSGCAYTGSSITHYSPTTTRSPPPIPTAAVTLATRQPPLSPGSQVHCMSPPPLPAAADKQWQEEYKCVEEEAQTDLDVEAFSDV